MKNNIFTLIVTGLAALGIFFYLSGGTDSPGKSATIETLAKKSKPHDADHEISAKQSVIPFNQKDLINIDEGEFYAQKNLSTASEKLSMARLKGIPILQRRALRGDRFALETLQRLIKAGDNSFRMEALELMSRSVNVDKQKNIIALMQKPVLSDKDVDEAILDIIGTFEETEAVPVLENQNYLPAIRRRGR